MSLINDALKRAKEAQQQAAPAAAAPAGPVENTCAPTCEPQKVRKIVGYKNVTKRVPIYAREKA